MHFSIKNHWFFFLTLLITVFLWVSGKNHEVFLWINGFGYLFHKTAMNIINDVTDFDIPILPGILLLITFFFRRDKLINVIFLIVTFFVLFDLLKLGVHEARPYIQHHSSDIYWLSSSTKENLKSAYRSFPSGHTGNVAIFVFTLNYLFAKSKIWIQCVFILPLVFIMLVRMLTGWHFPLDVLCASLIAYILVHLIMNLSLPAPRFKPHENHKRKMS